MPADPSLTGRRAVVTGSSTGIGRAIAIALADAGAEVVVHGRTESSALEQTVRTIASQGGTAEVLVCDLSSSDATSAFVTDVERRPVDVLINNAGVDVLTGPASERSFEEKLHALWEVDVVATIALSRSIGARMQGRRRGVILNMGWDQAMTGMEGDSGQMFAAVKGAIMSFTRSLAKSLAPDVRVNCLAPGWIQTEWGSGASADWQRRAVGESLLKRWGTPDDVARVARFLASDESAFITGQIVNINGGIAGPFGKDA